jgi:aspartyl-tRNA(Asn)/glutamyl-tRNA(Gln) amidotransferase subunit A
VNDALPTIADAAAAIANQKLSPVELTQACLDRISRHDAQLHCFITLTAERALAEARAAEAEIVRFGPRSPLHGIPIGLKDIYETKGLRTTAHSRQLEDHVPGADATTVRKLADAGTVLVGKLATHEFALGGPSFDLPWPPARNTWARRAGPAPRWPPVSSSAVRAPTPAARSARRRRTAGSPGSSRPMGA